MWAIVTGDLINSADYPAQTWMGPLKDGLSQFGTSPGDWEIYRGDEFQLRLPPKRAMEAAVVIKSRIKSIRNLDVRMAIGIGEEDYIGQGVSDSNGPAYLRSGRMLDQLKSSGVNLGIDSGEPATDQLMNLMIKLALVVMDSWSAVSAEIVREAMRSPDASQDLLAARLHIKQSAVSQRKKRAKLPLIREFLDFYAANFSFEP